MSNVSRVAQLKYQAGFSAGGIILALVLFTVVVKVAYAVAPAYYDNRLVVSALEELAEKQRANLKDIRKSDVTSHLSKFYQLNNVRNPVILKALEVDKRKERTIIKVDYEVRSNFAGNLDFVLTFQNHLDSSKPDECCTPSEKK